MVEVKDEIEFITLDFSEINKKNEDYDLVYLPIPVRFDEEWFELFKNLNLKNKE